MGEEEREKERRKSGIAIYPRKGVYFSTVKCLMITLQLEMCLKMALFCPFHAIFQLEKRYQPNEKSAVIWAMSRRVLNDDILLHRPTEWMLFFIFFYHVCRRNSFHPYDRSIWAPRLRQYIHKRSTLHSRARLVRRSKFDLLSIAMTETLWKTSIDSVTYTAQKKIRHFFLLVLLTDRARALSVDFLMLYWFSLLFCAFKVQKITP